MDSIGLGDLLAVMNQRDNDNWGSSWFWVIILFFFFAFFGRWWRFWSIDSRRTLRWSELYSDSKWYS